LPFQFAGSERVKVKIGGEASGEVESMEETEVMTDEGPEEGSEEETKIIDE
jgi:hypothetical protein